MKDGYLCMSEADGNTVPLLTLEDLQPAIFRNRPNRFIGIAELDGVPVRLHIPDPGRLKELLYQGNSILIRKAPEGSSRRTSWSLIAASGSSGWVPVNTFLHRRISEAILRDPGISPFGELTGLKAEVTPESMRSRFDFRIELPGGRKIWLEVKGCTLKEGEAALFPDAPTARGTRHLRELAELSLDGACCSVMFLVFPGNVSYFMPNIQTDPEFTDAFYCAVEAGVEMHPVRLGFDGRDITFRGTLPWR